MILDWLDKYIIEQANTYSMSPALLADLMSDAAEYQELIELGVVPELGDTE